jgi:hypothetical protein
LGWVNSFIWCTLASSSNGQNVLNAILNNISFFFGDVQFIGGRRQCTPDKTIDPTQVNDKNIPVIS